MKALTLWQPWASLVAIGAKRVETRSWATSYRGPLAIHAAKVTPHKARALTTQPFIYTRMVGAPFQGGSRLGYPEGVVLAIVELVDCVPAETWIAQELANDSHYNVARESELGDLSPGRFAWVLGKRELLPNAIPARGRQQLWNWERPS